MIIVFAKYQSNAQGFAKDFFNLAKVAKFRQIWSHCQRGSVANLKVVVICTVDISSNIVLIIANEMSTLSFTINTA